MKNLVSKPLILLNSVISLFSSQVHGAFPDFSANTSGITRSSLENSRLDDNSAESNPADEKGSAQYSFHANGSEKLVHFNFGVKLGKGTFGRVYQICTEDGELLVVKEPNSGFSLEKEINALSSLTHKHIIQFRGRYGKTRFIMEYIDLSLHTLISDVTQREQTLNQNLMRKIVRQLLGALAHCHSFGIIHCDLKPNNIRMTRDGVIKLADFSSAEAQELLEDGTYRDIPGSENNRTLQEAWLAPEIKQGKNYDATVDIYALKDVVQQMASGHELANLHQLRAFLAICDLPKGKRPGSVALQWHPWLHSTDEKLDDGALRRNFKDERNPSVEEDEKRPTLPPPVALASAIRAGDLDWIKFLLETKADPNATNEESPQLSLLIAVSQGSFKAAKLLLLAKANIHQTGKDGKTVLKHIQEKPYPSVMAIRFLLRNGADPEKPQQHETKRAEQLPPEEQILPIAKPISEPAPPARIDVKPSRRKAPSSTQEPVRSTRVSWLFSCLYRIFYKSHLY